MQSSRLPYATCTSSSPGEYTAYLPELVISVRTLFDSMGVARMQVSTATSPETRERLDEAGGVRELAHDTARGYEEAHVGVALFALEQGRELAELVEGKVRASENNELERLTNRSRQLFPRAPQGSDADTEIVMFFRGFASKGILERRGFGRHADDMEQSDAARSRCRCSQRFELILVR